MKSFKILISGCLIISAFLNVHAQFGMGKIEEIEQVQHRKLIVVTEEPRDHVIKKLTRKKKESELNNYKDALHQYNDEMKEVVEKFWPYKDKGVEYKTYEQVEKLNKAGNKGYVVLYCISKQPSAFRAGYLAATGLNWTWKMKDESEDRDYFDYFTTMIINRIEDLRKTPVYETPLPDIFPAKASLVFGINAIKSYFDYRIRTKKKGEKINQQEMMDEMVKENAPKLKNMTLLLRKDWLHKDLPETEIGKHYLFKYKVCTKEEMDDAIVNQQEQTAYVIILPVVGSGSQTNFIIYLHYIYDAKTSEMMAYIMPNMGSMMGAAYIGGKAGKRTIESKNLKKFTDQINGKE